MRTLGNSCRMSSLTASSFKEKSKMVSSLRLEPGTLVMPATVCGMNSSTTGPDYSLSRYQSSVKLGRNLTINYTKTKSVIV